MDPLHFGLLGGLAILPPEVGVVQTSLVRVGEELLVTMMDGTEVGGAKVAVSPLGFSGEIFKGLVMFASETRARMETPEPSPPTGETRLTREAELVGRDWAESGLGLFKEAPCCLMRERRAAAWLRGVT